MKQPPSFPGSYTTSKAPATVLSNRNFILIWAAYGISAFGDHLSELGLMKVMGFESEGTQQVRMQAAMLFVFFLPFFVLGPIAGTLADRLNRKHMMIAADLIRAGLVAGIPWLLIWLRGYPTVAVLLPLLGLGIFAAMFSPARLSWLPSLVRDEHLTQANSLSNGLGVVASMISFLVGGYLAARNPQWNFRLDAVTFVASAMLLSLIPHRHAAANRGRFWSDLGAGVRYIRTHARVVQLVVLNAVFWIAAAAFNSVIPTVLFRWYKPNDPDLGYTELGIFKGTLGMGMLAGALMLSWLGDAVRGAWVITWSLVGAGLMLLAFSVTNHFYPGVVLAVGVGFFGVGILVSVTTLIQRLVPDWARGRVFGIKDVVSMFGLLTATGILGLAPIPQLDSYVRPILIVLAVFLLSSGAVTLYARHRRSAHGMRVSFYKNLNEFLAKWWYRLRRIGPCTIPREGPVIVTANHTSGIDPLLLIAASPYRIPAFMVAREYYRLPLLHGFMAAVNCIPVRRDGQDISATKAAIRHLREGRVMGIFMQGRIPCPGEDIGPKDGAAMLALKTGAVVVPAYISGTRYYDSVLASHVSRHRAEVRYGPPVDLSEFAGVKNRDTLRAASEKIWQAINALRPDDPTQ